jgi:carboxypeptidase family protein
MHLPYDPKYTPCAGGFPPFAHPVPSRLDWTMRVARARVYLFFAGSDIIASAGAFATQAQARMHNAQLKRQTDCQPTRSVRVSSPWASLLTAPLLTTLVTTLLALSPVGGQIAHPTPNPAAIAPRADTGATASLSGSVFDSVAVTALVGADVQLVGLDDRSRVYTVRTDSFGQFRVPAMYPGRYAAGFFHSALDALGIAPPVRAVVVHAGSDNVVQLAIAGPERIMNAICGAHLPTDSAGAMAGIARDADSGLPIAGAKVVVTWSETTIDAHGITAGEHRMPVQTGDDGTYHVCGLPGADTVLASAEAPSGKTGMVLVAVPIAGVARRDFLIGDSTSAVAVVTQPSSNPKVEEALTVIHGSSRLTGFVRGPQGEPMSGATVVVWGTGRETTTQPDGSFTLAGLPAGTFSVEARILGFEPKDVPVDLSRLVQTSVTIAFSDRVQQLTRVVIKGAPKRTPLEIQGFFDRSRNGQGHYILASDEVVRTAREVTDVLRMTPGIQIAHRNHFDHTVLMRGRCMPAVYVDGIEETDGAEVMDNVVTPPEIAGIEIYAGLGEAPVQYSAHGCGVILIWTKRQ